MGVDKEKRHYTQATYIGEARKGNHWQRDDVMGKQLLVVEWWSNYMSINDRVCSLSLSFDRL